MIKAVFIDIDETLTNSQREVTEKTKLEIKKCVENGVEIYNERIDSSNGASINKIFKREWI